MDRNLIRANPFYPGQWGVRGSDANLGLRAVPRANTYYVDSGSAAANDDNDGTDPNFPFLTIQKAVNKVSVAGDQIIVAPGVGYQESVVTRPYETDPGYVSLIGLTDNRYTPYWESDAAALPCLDLRAPGWFVTGFRFAAPTTEACIVLRHTDTGANDIAIATWIENNYFYGQTTGLQGIRSHGCYEVVIKNNKFGFFHNVATTAVALVTGACPLAIPYRCDIIDNVFVDNDNHVDGEFNGCLFKDNVFWGAGKSYTPTISLDVAGGVGSGGANCVITGNFLGGGYKNPLYVGHASDEWYGNTTNPAGETVPGVTVHPCGLTIARPVA